MTPPLLVESPCGRHRYARVHHWGEGERLVTWYLLHPTTGLGNGYGPEARRCYIRTKKGGYDGMVLLFLFSLKCAEHRHFRSLVASGADSTYLQGPEVDSAFLEFTSTESVVCAWGADGALDGQGLRRVRSLQERGTPPLCLGRARNGQPEHVLYVPLRDPLLPYSSVPLEK